MPSVKKEINVTVSQREALNAMRFERRKDSDSAMVRELVQAWIDTGLPYLEREDADVAAIRFQLLIGVDELAALKKAAADSGFTVAETVRRLIDKETK